MNELEGLKSFQLQINFGDVCSEKKISMVYILQAFQNICRYFHYIYTVRNCKSQEGQDTNQNYSSNSSSNFKKECLSFLILANFSFNQNFLSQLAST